ncbi:MAG: glycosyl transferase [Gammaproteobacteria bacterium SG8_11]|nr:MAG: glycosyl transferase [Gammaproteobacteria bacterium SG8_11]
MRIDKLSIVLPARNEAKSLQTLLPALNSLYPGAEIIVVNDGSNDGTREIIEQFEVIQISHPYSLGNGAAIKSGARMATGDVILFMDADGQHDPADIKMLLEKYEDGFDMVVGARVATTHASFMRRIANNFYNKLASFMTGHKILDLTSGLRLVNARKFGRFLYLLPNGFSYPTTSTMAFYRSGFPVAYVPIHASPREGKSKIRLLHDGFRFVIIILKIGALFSPMRLFVPVSFLVFLAGISYYAFTYFNDNRFTNMSALLLISSLFIFLIGILSEQISMLHYKNADSFESKNSD